MTTSGGWLTGARLSRLPIILTAIRGHPPPGPRQEDARRVIWRRCGGPMSDVPDLIGALISAGLVTLRDDRLRLTRAGTRVATQDHQSGGTQLALALLHAGHCADQARVLIESGAVDSDGTFACPRGVAVAVAPQLVGLLRRFPAVIFAQSLVLPADLLRELEDVWAIPTAREAHRQDIGKRGELYTYRYERLRAADPAKIRWVALDNDGLGYDIEDLNGSPRRSIEVKASTGVDVRFILSRNEWEVAHSNPIAYEVQFWGGVNLARTPRDDYETLRRAGFPVVLRDLPQLLADGALTATASAYLVTAP